MAFTHDTFFKFAFGDPVRAGELLDVALSRLPTNVAGPQISRLKKLQLRSESFVAPDGAKTYSDLLFETSIGKEEAPLFVYALYEHKSAPQAHTVRQLLRYMTDIWNRVARPADTRLAPIIPIIVYHGATRWRKPRCFRDYFERHGQDVNLRSIGPELNPIFLNVLALGPHILRRLSPQSRSALAALAFAATGRAEYLPSVLAPEITEAQDQTGQDFLRSVTGYLFSTSTPEKRGVIFNSVGTSATREAIMTIADELRNEGALRTSRQMLVRQLSKKFGLTDAERELIENVDDVEKLGRAIDDFVFAQTKEEVLATLRG